MKGAQAKCSRSRIDMVSKKDRGSSISRSSAIVSATSSQFHCLVVSEERALQVLREPSVAEIYYYVGSYVPYEAT